MRIAVNLNLRVLSMPTGGHGEGLHDQTYIIRALMTQQARKKECNSRPYQSPSGLAALSVTLLSRLQEAHGERLHLHLDAQFYDPRGRYLKVLGRAHRNA